MQLAADWVHRVPKDVAMQKLLDQCNDDADLFIRKRGNTDQASGWRIGLI